MSQHSPDTPTPTPQRAHPALEEKYDYLTRLGTQMLCLIHPQRGCTYLSKNFTRITGNPTKACMGEAFATVIDAENNERLQELLEDGNTQDFPKTMHMKLRHADGSWQWYSCNLNLPDDETSEAYICILENIHEHVQAQATLNKAKLEAEMALSTRSEFLANMSHELRTPLNAVIGFAQIIEEQMFGQVNSQYLDYARHIQESGHDLLGKIEDLLEIASIDAGRVSLDRKEVQLNTILKHAIAAQSHHAAHAEVLIEYAPPASGDMRLYVDRVKLQHMIGHLLANAIKFSHPGGKVVVEASKAEPDGMVLRISDHGIGMHEGKLKDLQATLQEGNCWGSGGTRSIGLGLALTREFVVMHGGEVAVHSAIGDGTTVEIFLPEECIAHAAFEDSRAYA